MNAAQQRDITLDSTVCAALQENGYATSGRLLSAAQCRSLRDAYTDNAVAFRSTIDMARYNFGKGQYRYFAYPLPDIVQDLREKLYRSLAPIANEWERQLGKDGKWPATLQALLERCHAAEQTRPTPLLLKYGAGDYNCLHQDLYGPIHFPLQAVILLSDPQKDFDGGELILVEQRPRMQSRPIVVRLRQGEAAIIPVRERPRMGVRGYHRVQMRHGVGEVLRGERLTLGVIFHDAA